MNKSPEFDMLKEPAEPESTTDAEEEKKERGKGTEKGVSKIMRKQKCIRWVSLRGQTQWVHMKTSLKHNSRDARQVIVRKLLKSS